MRLSRCVVQTRAMATIRSNLELLTARESGRERRTAIVCTVGQRGSDRKHLAELIASGMGVMRLNMSHSSPADAAPRVAALQGVLRETAAAVTDHTPPTPLSQSTLETPLLPVAIDLKGPEIRTGRVEGGGEVVVADGSEVELLHGNGYCTPTVIYHDYASIGSTLRGGSGMVYIDDGLIQLRVEEIRGDAVRCVAVNGGRLGSRKGVNLPGCSVDLPAVSDKDRADLRFAVESGCDLVFASFVRSAAQVQEVKEVLRSCGGGGIGVIAKIENQEGLDNLAEIVAAADGIMVARGDLGIEIPPEEVVRAQKAAIARALVSAKPAICATQMLESMVDRPRATRAEVSDVGNAVIDGADCVMLSGETAKGMYPNEAVATMGRVCVLAESITPHQTLSEQIRKEMVELGTHPEWTRAWAEAAVSASFSYKSPLIVCLALTARTARLIASMRPRARVLMPCPTHSLCAIAALHSGLEPLLCPELGFDARKSQCGGTIERHVVARAIEYGRRRGYCQPGDVVIASHNEYNRGGDASSVLRFIRVPEKMDLEDL